MDKSTPRKLFLGLAVTCTLGVGAQEIRSLKVQKHTVLEQYEPGLMLSREDRIRLKEERLATFERRKQALDTLVSQKERRRLLQQPLKKERWASIEERKRILDTLRISDRKKERLLRELLENPFSDKFDKAIAKIEFSEDASEE